MKNVLLLLIVGVFLSLPARSNADGTLFWTDRGNGRVSSVTTSGTTLGSPTTLYSSRPRPTALAVSSDKSVLHWIDPQLGAVRRAVPPGAPVSAHSGLVSPEGAAVASQSNLMFFTDHVGNDKILYSIPADRVTAGVATELLRAVSPNGPVYLDVDENTSKLYWSDDSGVIHRCAYNGSSVETVVSTGSTGIAGIAVDSVNGYVYWTDQSAQTVNRAATSSVPATPETVISDNSVGGGIAVDTSASPPIVYWTNPGGSQIVSMQFGSPTSLAARLTISNGLATPVDVAFIPDAAPTPTPTPTPTPSPTPTPQDTVLRRDTTIDTPPDVSVSSRSITVTMQDFTDVNFDKISALRELGLPESVISSRTVAVRYDVRVTAERKRDSERRVTKKSETTFKRLKPGEYSVKYRATAYQKRTPAQRKKASSRGATGFNRNYKKSYSTPYSPPRDVTVSRQGPR